MSNSFRENVISWIFEECGEEKKTTEKKIPTSSWLVGGSMVERNGLGANMFNDDCWIGRFFITVDWVLDGMIFCGDGVRLWSVVGADTTVWELSSSKSDTEIMICLFEVLSYRHKFEQLI